MSDKSPEISDFLYDIGDLVSFDITVNMNEIAMVMARRIIDSKHKAYDVVWLDINDEHPEQKHTYLETQLTIISKGMKQ